MSVFSLIKTKSKNGTGRGRSSDAAWGLALGMTSAVVAGRAGRTTKVMCDLSGSLRPARRQGDQGRAANCCTLREGGQGFGTIRLRDGGITGLEVYFYLI